LKDSSPEKFGKINSFIVENITKYGKVFEASKPSTSPIYTSKGMFAKISRKNEQNLNRSLET